MVGLPWQVVLESSQNSLPGSQVQMSIPFILVHRSEQELSGRQALTAVSRHMDLPSNSNNDRKRLERYIINRLVLSNISLPLHDMLSDWSSKPSSQPHSNEPSVLLQSIWHGMVSAHSLISVCTERVISAQCNIHTVMCSIYNNIHKSRQIDNTLYGNQYFCAGLVRKSDIISNNRKYPKSMLWYTVGLEIFAVMNFRDFRSRVHSRELNS